MITYDILKQANKWFYLHNINVLISNGKMYINEGRFEFELSSDEIVHRAEEYKRLKQDNLTK